HRRRQRQPRRVRPVHGGLRRPGPEAARRLHVGEVVMTDFTFTKATKKAAKGRIAIDGPSGSGKTYTALTIATTLGDRIAVIDTEHGSASKYADLFDFDTLHLHRYSPQILIDALAAAAAGGYDVVAIDSLSHFWMGTDGM